MRALWTLPWAGLFPLVTAAAQMGPACHVRTGPSVPVILPDGRTVTSQPSSIVRSGATLAVFGTPTWTWMNPKGVVGPGPDRGLLGFIRRGDGRVSLVRAPAGLDSARYPRAVAAGDAWDVVFFVPDSANPGGGSRGENGVLWYGQWTGNRWRSLQSITVLRAASIRPEASSPLVRRNGQLYVAVGVEGIARPGGVLLMTRDAGGRWRVDSVPLPDAPLTATIGAPRRPGDPVEAYVVADTAWKAGRSHPGALQVIRFGTPPTPARVVMSGSAISMGQPRILPFGSEALVTWWEMGARGDDPARILTSPLPDSTGVDTYASAQTITTGTIEFSAVPLTTAVGPAALWLYRTGAVTSELAATLRLGGKLSPASPIAVRNQAHYNAAPAGGAAVDLVTIALPTPGSTERPATLLTRLEVECPQRRMLEP